MSTGKAKSMERAEDDSLTCGSCQARIDTGEAIRRDATRRAHHVYCKRRGITPHVPRDTPRTWASPIPAPSAELQPRLCPGCTRLVTAEDFPTTVTVFGDRWHRECRHREVQGDRS